MLVNEQKSALNAEILSLFLFNLVGVHFFFLFSLFGFLLNL